MNWSSDGASIQMSYGGTSIGGSLPGGSVPNETVPCAQPAPDGRGVVVSSGDRSYLLYFYAGMDTSITPNELFVVGVIEPSDGTGAIYPEFHALVDPNTPTTIHFDIGVDTDAQALFLTWWNSTASMEDTVQSNPGPPDAKSNPGPPDNAETLGIYGMRGVGDSSDSSPADAFNVVFTPGSTVGIIIAGDPAANSIEFELPAVQ